MSWVLILNTDYVAKPPTIIGGYATREEAEAAGETATAFKNKPNQVLVSSPYYCRYSVIPGAACSGPLGSTHSYVAPNPDNYSELKRWTERF